MAEEIIKKLGLDNKKPTDWTEEDLLRLATQFRKTTKPMIIACNKMDVSTAEENYKRLREKFPHLMMVPCSAESELALREAAKHGIIKYIPGENNFEIIEPNKLNDKQKAALQFIKNNVLEKYGSTGVQQVLDQAVFNLLKYIAIFPGGVNKLSDSQGRVMPDCFLMPPATTALAFAYKLHTDLGNNFIRAIDVKTKRTVGKEHPLKQGDVVEIISGK